MAGTTGRARSAGRPGSSARVVSGVARAKLLQSSWATRIQLFLLITGTGALIGTAGGYPPLTSAGVTAGVVLGGIGLMLSLNSLMLIGVLVAYAPFTLVMGNVYTYAAGGAITDRISGVLNLAVAALVCLFVSVRYSRGRAWLTLALALGSTIVISPLILYVAPGLGLNAARLTMAVTLLWRCGGGAWITGAVALGWTRVRYWRESDTRPVRAANVDDLNEDNAWKRRAQAEQATAEVLDTLPEGFHVFHDVNNKKMLSSLAHLVVGPTGGALIASVKATGLVTESRADGLKVPGVQLDRVTGLLLEQRKSVAKALKSNVRDFTLIVVVHSKVKGDQVTRRAVAVFDPADPTAPIGQVVLVGPEDLVSEVDTGFGIWSPVKVAQVARRATMRLAPATFPVPLDTTFDMPVLSVMDDDGKPTVNPAEIAPSWIQPGVPVHIMTSLGLLSDLRVTGLPYLDNTKTMVVNVCVEEEWQSAKGTSRNPRAYPYPIRSIKAA